MKENNESNTSSNAIAIAERNDEVSSFNKINLFDERSVAAAEVTLKKLMASPKSGITSVSDGLAVLLKAQELNLPFSCCTEHIHVVNGKTSTDIHIIKSLLLRAGVTWECTKDYAPQYQYTDGNTIYLDTQFPEYCVRCRTPKEAESKTTDDKIGVYPLRYYADLNNNIYNEFQISDKCVKCINKVQAIQKQKEGLFPVIRVEAKPVDFVTEYKFTRYRPIYGKIIIQTAISHFSFNDAVKAEFFTKDTYKKYPKVMIGHRAFTLGARDIASDLLMGVLEETEAALINGKLDESVLQDAEYEDM